MAKEKLAKGKSSDGEWVIPCRMRLHASGRLYIPDKKAATVEESADAWVMPLRGHEIDGKSFVEETISERLIRIAREEHSYSKGAPPFTESQLKDVSTLAHFIEGLVYWKSAGNRRRLRRVANVLRDVDGTVRQRRTYLYWMAELVRLNNLRLREESVRKLWPDHLKTCRQKFAECDPNLAKIDLSELDTKVQTVNPSATKGKVGLVSLAAFFSKKVNAWGDRKRTTTQIRADFRKCQKIDK